MNKRSLELIGLALVAIAGVAMWLIAGQDGETPASQPADSRPRSPTGRCPACKSFVKKAQPGDVFNCARCGAELFQETTETVVEQYGDGGKNPIL